MLADEDDPDQAITGSVADALRLGAGAVGFTIYPGSTHRNAMYGQIREIAEEAKAYGLAVVVWSYARGSALSKAGETAIDVIGYAAQIAAQLGAHIIKVKLPTDHIEQAAAKKIYEGTKIPIATAAERVAEIKRQMLACHASQRDWLIKQHGIDEYLEAQARWGARRGAEIGVAAADEAAAASVVAVTTLLTTLSPVPFTAKMRYW